jgi:hypothetical protein
MPDGLTFVSVIIGFALIAIAGARLGAGMPAALAGLFPADGVRDWPTGVQEPDAPHFNLDVVPSPPVGVPDLGPAPAVALASEIEEIYAGPIR